MKILLIGEYSGLHGDLAAGLIENGHEVTFVGYKDTFKNHWVQINVDSNMPGLFGKIVRRFRAFVTTYKLKGYDVVQVINPWAFGHYFPYRIVYRRLKRNNGKLFFLAAGIDSYYWKYANSVMRYSPINDMKVLDKGNNNSFMNTRSAMHFNDWCLSISDGFIPVAYDFEVCYQNHPKLLDRIPMPINLTKIKNVGVSQEDNYKIFHGLNRKGFKGTKHVEKAFEFINSAYGELVSTSIQGRLSFDAYADVLRNADIVIDQTSSYGFGMNALYAMALGKVVLGGSESESNTIYSHPNPAINILPDHKDIIAKIEMLIKDKKQLATIGRRSRSFVESEHDYRMIANKYVKAWMATL